MVASGPQFLADDIGEGMVAGTTADGFRFAQDSDAFGSGRVGDPWGPFCNRPF